MNKHLVIYMGNGLWRDKDGKLWGNSDRSDIVVKRVFKTDKSQEDFLNDRSDIAFMVNYGQMSIESLGMDDKEPDREIIEDQPKNVQPAGMSITP